MLMNYYREIDRTRVQFDFLVHSDRPGEFDDEINDLGGRIFKMPSLAPKNALQYWRAMRSLIKANPDISIFHSHLNALSGIPLAMAKTGRIPVRIAHSHNTQFHVVGAKAAFLNIAKRIAPLVSTDLVGCSEVAAKFMFGNKQYSIIKNAINPTPFNFERDVRRSIREEFGVAEDAFLIGNVGNLRRQKNHLFLLKVFRDLLDKQPNSKLIIVGKDSGELGELTAFIQSNGIENKVILTGGRSDISRVLQAIDIFVMPSLYEGLPVVSIEAQASGLPCLFSASVTSELALSERCVFLELNQSLGKWSDTILSMAHKFENDDRRQVAEEIIDSSGYDVRVEANKLSDFYFRSLESKQKSKIEDKP